MIRLRADFFLGRRGHAHPPRWCSCLSRRRSGTMPEVRRSFYCDEVYGENYWTLVSEELPALLARMFRISAAREDLRPGAHSWDFWDTSIQDALDWMPIRTA